MGAAVPSASYYWNQAQLLLRWADAVTDPVTAERMRKRARELLSRADQAGGSSNYLSFALDEFNAQQMALKRPAQPVQQQQQQQQPQDPIKPSSED